MNSPATHRIVAFATAGCAVLAAASLATADPGSYRQIPTRPILTLTTAFPVPLLAQRPSVTSERWPRVTVGVPEEFSLLGSTTIDLYGVATAEIHALAEAEGGMVRRLYWVQFEGYHEDSSSTYDYSREPWRVELDGRSFYAGPNAYPKEDLTEASEGSDSSAIVELVRRAGLVLPDEIARVRLVHLDDSRRNELMIIYLEDLALSGTSLAALETDIPARNRLAEAIRDRAVAGLDIR